MYIERTVINAVLTFALPDRTLSLSGNNQTLFGHFIAHNPFDYIFYKGLVKVKWIIFSSSFIENFFHKCCLLLKIVFAQV